MKDKIVYEFSARVWRYASPGGWYFVSLPIKMAKEIRTHLKWQEQGWGRLKANVQVGTDQWESAIWFDTKKNTYLLPLKAEIRKRQHLETGSTIKVTVWI